MNSHFLSRFLDSGQLEQVENFDQSLSCFELDYVKDNGDTQRIDLPDYAYWLNKELWTVHEALSLSLGVNPSMVRPYVGDEMYYIPGPGLHLLSNELCYRFDALKSSKLMEVEGHCNFKTKRTPTEFIAFLSEKYPNEIPLPLLSEKLVCKIILQIESSGYTDNRKSIEQFNLFFCYMSFRIPGLINANGRILGTVSNMIAAFEKMLSLHTKGESFNLGRFEGEDNKKALRKALKLKPHGIKESTVKEWKESWERDGIPIQPLAFAGNKENPWLAFRIEQ